MTTERLSDSDVLVTGGAGFIGCAISQLIAPASRRYLVFDNLHPQVHRARERPAMLHPAAELVVGDVTDAGTWDRVLAGIRPEIVIHLAAETGTGQSLTESARHATVNVVGTAEMLDAFTRNGHRVQHLVLSSSRAVYGEGAWQQADGTIVYPGQRNHERLEAGEWDFVGMRSLPSAAAATRPDPTSVYGATKLAQEHMLAAWARAMEVPLTILRLQNVYGPGQSLTNSYTGIVALFSQLAKARRSIPLYEDGKVTRDFVYIDDVARAFVSAVSVPRTRKLVADVGSGHATSLIEMARLLANFYDAPQPVITGQFRDGDVRHASCDIKPTLTMLGWTPDYDLPTGLVHLQDWIMQSATSAHV